VVSIGDVNGKLKSMQARVPAAVTAAALAMALDFTAEVKTNELTRYTHAEGTPTPSPPGEPPALISGALRGSVYPQPPVSEGAQAEVTVGGTVIYARIQELGGWAGRGHASYLPPRPYLKPAAERVIGSGQATKAAVRGWLTVMQ
jgi:hypothetical protein